MIVRLTRPTKVLHPAGDTVTVSPEVAAFLFSVGSAVSAEAKEEAKVETPEKKTTKKAKK